MLVGDGRAGVRLPLAAIVARLLERGFGIRVGRRRKHAARTPVGAGFLPLAELADIEAVILMANDEAARESDSDAPVLASHFQQAAIDYFPSRDVELLEYMELLAVFESSSRRLLPAKYATLTPEDLDAKLRHLRAIVGTGSGSKRGDSSS